MSFITLWFGDLSSDRCHNSVKSLSRCKVSCMTAFQIEDNAVTCLCKLWLLLNCTVIVSIIYIAFSSLNQKMWITWQDNVAKTASETWMGRPWVHGVSNSLDCEVPLMKMRSSKRRVQVILQRREHHDYSIRHDWPIDTKLQFLRGKTGFQS